MGDRTWLELNIKPEDSEHVLGVLPDPTEIKHDEDNIMLYYEEENYGGYSELEQLAREGVIFSGSHGDGGDYSSASFYVRDKEVIYTLVDQQGGLLVPFPLDREAILDALSEPNLKVDTVPIHMLATLRPDLAIQLMKFAETDKDKAELLKILNGGDK